MKTITSTIINAPAGSGKTTLLIENLLKNPTNSLTLTFTTKSHLNLTKRAHNILPQNQAEFKALNILTIDSFLYKLFQADKSIKIPFKSLLSEAETSYLLDDVAKLTLEILYQDSEFEEPLDYLSNLYENDYDKMLSFVKSVLKSRSYFFDLYQNIDNLDSVLAKEYESYKQNFYDDFFIFLKTNQAFLSLVSLLTKSPSSSEGIAVLESLILTKTGISRRFPIKEKVADWKDFLDANPSFISQLAQYFSIHKLLSPQQNFSSLALSVKFILQIFKLSYAVMMTKFAEIEKQDHLNLLINVRQLFQKNHLLLKNLNIDYLLIDEFQDTSIDHYLIILEILKISPCPIFFIGDPMQSIYSFRDANLGNFIRIFTNNEPVLHHLSLQSSTLSTNYRSSRKIVEFVNLLFSKQEKANSIFFNKISYSPSIPQKDYEDSQVKIYTTSSTLEAIFSVIGSTTGELAILVRKQSQVNIISAYLEEKNIQFSATHTTTSKQNPLLQNLLTLTNFLYDPSREHSLLLLHSIWFDINIQSIIELVSPFDEPALSNFFEKIKGLRYKKSWQDLLKLALDILNDQFISSEVLEIFLNTLSLSTEKGIINFDKLTFLLKERSKLEKTELSSRIHLMTIHQAKGLEFDSVIIPFCEEGVKIHREPIIFYRELDDSSPNKALTLLSDKNNPLYEVLHQQKKYRQANEEERIFYVALTRAKQNLFLIESQDARKQSNSFASMLPEIVKKEEILFENLRK